MNPFVKRRSVTTLPDWAQFAPKEKYEEFLAKVEQYFGRVAGAKVYSEGYVDLSDGTRLGLPNVYQKWLAASLFKKADAIRSHFDTILANLGQRNSLDPDAFKVIVLAPEYPNDSDSVMAQEIGAGVYLALVQDDVKYLQYHSYNELHVLGLSEQQVWDLAVNQTIRDEETSWKFTQQKNSSLLIAEGKSSFTSTGIAFLDRIAPCNQAVVAIPTRHILMLFPFDSGVDGRAIKGLTRIAKEAYDRGPGSLYPELFLWERDKPLQAYRSS